MKSILFALLLALAAPQALACSCLAPQPIEDAVASSSRVFAGTVTAVEPGGAFTRRVTFGAIDHFKGSPVAALTVVTTADGAMCGYPFIAGSRYVVYSDGEDGALRTSSCSRTSLAEATGSDLEALRARRAR